MTSSQSKGKGQRAKVLLVTLLSLASVSGMGAQQETIAEIRVHGNHTTPDADVISLSGLSTGAAAFMLNFDLAWPEEGKPRGHFAMGLGF